MRQMTPDLLLHPVFDEAEALAGMPHREVIHPPRSIGLIKFITRSIGCDRCRRNTSLSARTSAVRFLSLGVFEIPCDNNVTNTFARSRSTFQFDPPSFLEKQFIRLTCQVITDTI